MALQTIILTSFFFSFFFFFPVEGYAFSSHNFSKILSNRNDFLQTCSWVNIVVPDTFWAISDQGFRHYGASNMKLFLKFSSCYFRQDFKYRDFHEDIYLQNPNGWTDFDARQLIGSALAKASIQMCETWI